MCSCTETEVADQTSYLIQPHHAYLYIRLTSLSTEPMMQGTWQGSRQTLQCASYRYVLHQESGEWSSICASQDGHLAIWIPKQLAYSLKADTSQFGYWNTWTTHFKVHTSLFGYSNRQPAHLRWTPHYLDTETDSLLTSGGHLTIWIRKQIACSLKVDTSLFGYWNWNSRPTHLRTQWPV